MRAMSLVYTTLLSIVPLLAFSFSVLKGLGVFEQLRPYLTRLLSPLGAQGALITAEILSLVDNVRGSVLGGLGFVFFLYTVVSMIQKVESTFNYVWYVSTPRSIARRFSEYLVVLIVGPMLMVIAIGLITTLQSTYVVQLLLNNPQLGPLLVILGKTVPYLIISAVFTFLYKFMPNTRVNFKSALIGGVCGGVLWATMSAGFATFVIYSARTMQIYAGFAVAIMGLLWLYLNWLILLIGAQIAFYHQRPAFLRSGRREPRLSNAMRERLVLNIMYLVGRAYRGTESMLEFQALGRRLRINTLAMTPTINALERAGLLTATESGALMPAREMSKITLREITDVVRRKGDTGSNRPPAWSATVEQLGREFEDAIGDVLGDTTLADLLDRTDKQKEKSGETLGPAAR